MARELIEELLSYHDVCNRKLIQRFKEIGADAPQEGLKLLSHVLNAQHVWNRRMEGETPELAIWDRHSSERLEQLQEEETSRSLELLAEKELNEEVLYKNSKGNTFSNTVQDILFHIVNHGTYHRGQIARELRASGSEPPITDHVILKRNAL